MESNRELWRQTEERKRLNAAFSHDLRNPLTVLKGSAKIAKLCVTGENINTPQLMDNLTRIEAYTGRIEQYVETMSSVQRLEQVQPEKTTIDIACLSSDLNSALSFAAVESGKQLVFHGCDDTGTVTMDKGMLFQVAENLTTNALRFARQTVSITLSQFYFLSMHLLKMLIFGRLALTVTANLRRFHRRNTMKSRTIHA